MAQFDVHPTRGQAARLAPYLVELQSDSVADLATAVVAPLRKTGADKPLGVLHVPASLNGETYWLAVEELISLPRKLLQPPVANIGAVRPAVIAAVGFLFSGI
jgi:toxin CcdB